MTEKDPDESTISVAALLSRDRFDDLVRNPTSWIQSAQLLLRAADVLAAQHLQAFTDKGTKPNPLSGGRIITDEWKIVDFELFKPAYMLAALSLELAFKAVIVAKEPEILKKGERIAWGGRPEGHDLVHLSRRAGIPNADEQFLQEFKEFLLWKGRYPASNTGMNMYDGVPSFINFGGTHVGDEMKRFKAIYDAAKQEYRKFR